MPLSELREPYEIELGRLTIALLEILARDMDEAFCDLAHRPDTHPHSPLRETAQAAERVLALCGRLAHAIRRYQRCDTLRRHEEAIEREDAIDQDIPF